jgi:hypothetical protein
MDEQYESGLFKDCAQAEAALERLKAIGYEPDRISIIVADSSGVISGLPEGALPANDLGGKGVIAGTAVGGVLGAILAVAGSAIAIAGTAGAATPFVIGPLAAALAGLGAGAVTGTIVGGLLELGDHADDWRDWVEQGGAVVAVCLKSAEDRQNVRAALA